MLPVILTVMLSSLWVLVNMFLVLVHLWVVHTARNYSIILEPLNYLKEFLKSLANTYPHYLSPRQSSQLVDSPRRNPETMSRAEGAHVRIVAARSMDRSRK